LDLVLDLNEDRIRN